MYKIFCSLALICCCGSCFQMFGDSRTTLLKESINEKNGKKAVLLQNDGNATEGKSLGVSIYGASYKLAGNETGKVFTVDGDHGSASLDSSVIDFSWVGRDTLVIHYSGNLRVFTKETYQNGVFIEYEVKNSISDTSDSSKSAP